MPPNISFSQIEWFVTKNKTMQRYKIRRLTTNNKSGDAYGVTIPVFFAEMFKNTLFSIYPSGNGLILESGCAPKI